VAGGQWGRIGWWQLRDCGVGRATISEWVTDGYLFLELPRVYIVGHRAPSVEGDLTAAILYAGPGAVLSHGTAAWWWGLTDRKPNVIEVSTPRRCASRPGLRVYARRSVELDRHKRLPITAVPQTLLDYAASHPLDDVRYVLAEADYQRILDLDDVRQSTGRGKPGSTRLRLAVDHHWPELARTRSRVERAFLFLCEEGGLPRPLVNEKLYGMTVDVYWPQFRLAVELDGGRGHSTERQVARDHSRDLILRRNRITVRRYAEPQVLYDRDMVLQDLLSACRPSIAAPHPPTGYAPAAGSHGR
jgi:hypothetical protein